MRRLIVPIILVVLLAAVPATAGKIGFVDAERAVELVEEGKQKFEDLKAWQAPQQAKLDGLRDRVLLLREQLSRAQDSAAPEAILTIERNELDARRAFEDARRDYERELAERTDAFLAEIAAKIGTVGADYGKANDYDAVFLLTAQPMVYVSESADITDLVVEMYNERYPVSGQ
jgi:outer membrane protein